MEGKTSISAREDSLRYEGDSRQELCLEPTLGMILLNEQGWHQPTEYEDFSLACPIIQRLSATLPRKSPRGTKNNVGGQTENVADLTSISIRLNTLHQTTWIRKYTAEI